MTGITSGAGTANLSGNLRSSPHFSGIRVARSLFVRVMFCRLLFFPFVIFRLTIVLSVLFRFTDSDYSFGIFKIFIAFQKRPSLTSYCTFHIRSYWYLGTVASRLSHVGSGMLSRVLSTHEGVISFQSSSRKASGCPFRGVLPTMETFCLIYSKYWFKIDLVVKIILYLIKTFILDTDLRCLSLLNMCVQIPLITRCTRYRIV